MSRLTWEERMQRRHMGRRAPQRKPRKDFCPHYWVWEAFLKTERCIRKGGCGQVRAVSR